MQLMLYDFITFKEFFKCNSLRLRLVDKKPLYPPQILFNFLIDNISDMI